MQHSPLPVTRQQALAYRIGAHGLAREHTMVTDLDVLDLGIQDTPVGAAPQALAARVREGASGLADDPELARVWTFRGGPHVHRRSDLPTLATRLWPRTEADASARLSAARSGLAAGGVESLSAFEAASHALRATVDRPRPKADVSRAVTDQLPPAYAYDCRSCRARHIYGDLLQQVGLFAGVELTGDRPTTIAPLPQRWALPSAPTTDADVAALVRSYLRLHGPATARDVAGFLGTSRAQVAAVWPADMVEVAVDGRRAWIPAENADALAQPPLDPHDLVRLLPPLDPLLQARDRAVLVPEQAHRQEIWRVLGNPGVLLCDGEIAGTWRAKTTGRKRWQVTVTTFVPPRAGVRRRVEAEAACLAELRGCGEVCVLW